jgi:predicted nucleic acid-binding Zn ribbon protein
MSFKSLDNLLTTLQQQPQWESYHYYRQVLTIWETILDPALLSYTKPLAIRRQVLWVATLSPVWAQNLTLQRYGLLKKLNSQLTQPLNDIRFSAAQWHQVEQLKNLQSSNTLEQSETYSTFLTTLSFPDETEKAPAKSPEEAFQRWAKVLQSRSEQLPPCPRCQAPVLPQELERWSICGNCATKYLFNSPKC